jgi:hypothetical protein
MQHFYDGQIRRYVIQVIRVLSNFVVKYGDGSLHQIPVMYGDADRQAASIIRQNTENMVNSVPKIAVYISGLEIDRDRLSDSSYVGKVHIRERDVTDTTYNQAQGRNYTVERLMPTPFKLTIKADIWTSSTDQKLQILEQILVLFNPSLELQTTDNYIDWTSLSVLNLTQTTWSSRSMPVGNDSPIDICTLTFETPIWISPPVKVKHLGVITRIITSLWGQQTTSNGGYIEGLGFDDAGAATTFNDLLYTDALTIGDFDIQVHGNHAILASATGHHSSWTGLFDQYPGKFIAGSSLIYLDQPGGSAISGTFVIDPNDDTALIINYNPDTLVTNTNIDSQGRLQSNDQSYGNGTQYRPNSPGTFDAIINPLTFNPGTPAVGARFLLVEDIGSVDNMTPAEAWGTLVAQANDIIEWSGTEWNVIFQAAQKSDTMVWQTNIYTGVQYLWNGISWVKSFEGVYGPGQWRIVL